MSRVRLNTAVLREPRLLVKAPPTSGDLLAEDSVASPGITRREAVTIAGVAAAAMAGATGAVPALGALGPVGVSVSSRSARYSMGSTEFVLDPARFGGRARLVAGTTASGTSVALSGARFPGTAMPAGITLETFGSGATTRLRIRMDLGGFDAEVPLSKWLAGEAAACSAVTFAGETFPLKGLASFKLVGQGTATFTHDWRLTIEGPSIGRVSGLGRGVVGDRVTISLPAEEAPTLFTRRIKRRMLVVLERGEYSWALAAPSGNGAGAVALTDTAFDTLALESAETANGYPYRAVIAESTSTDTNAHFAAKALRNLTGKAASVPLAALRYARVFDSDDEPFMLAADFPEQTVWLHGPGYALLAGGGPGAATFEMTGNGRLADAVVCQPSVGALSVPMGDAVVEPIRFPEGSAAVARLGNTSPSAKPVKAQAIAINPDIIDVITNPDLVIIDPGLIDVILLPSTTTVRVTRPEDLLSLKFEFYNLSLDFSSTPPKLVRAGRTVNNALLAVTFPPQHILESAYNEFSTLLATPNEATAGPPIWSTIASESRLVFIVPNQQADEGIPYTLAGLLDWSKYDMSVADAARVTPSGSVPLSLEEPLASQTSIEAPWGLFLSPTQRARWSHKSDAVERKGVYELWHTRYVGDYRSVVIDFPDFPGFRDIGALPSPVGAAALTPGISNTIVPIARPPVAVETRLGLTSPKLRAVWARYYEQWKTEQVKPVPNTDIIPTVPLELRRQNSFTRAGDMSDKLGARNRWTIADITARYRKPAVDVRRLMLTSQGAWMNTLGNWPTDEYTLPPENLDILIDLLTWEHRMTQGRDHYVKLVFAGRIFPFGHKAVEVQITERKFKTAPGTGRPTAYLLTRTFIVIREPVKTYEFADFPGKSYRSRQTPFKRVEFKTTISPPIYKSLISNGTASYQTYWVRDATATSKNLPFQIEATDWDGTLIKLSVPLIFVDDRLAVYKSSTPASMNLANCATAYRGQSLQMGGQKMAYAEPLPASATKDTRHLPTNSMKFTAETLRPSSPGMALGNPFFYPKLYNAQVRLDIAEQITNQTASTPITLADVYVNNGYTGPNAKGMAFANVNPPTSGGSSVDGSISKLDTGGLPLPFPGSQAGGLATPSQVLKGLSAYAGPFGGAVDAFAGGFGNGTDFDPSDFFGELLEAKLIGGVTLIDILAKALGLDDIPGFTKRIEGPEGDRKLIIAFQWDVDNKSTQKIKKFFIFEPTSTTELHLKAEMTKSLSDLSAEPTTIIQGSLSNFYINLIGDSAEFLNLVFGTFSMSSINGGSPKINPGLEDVLFAGPLQFLNELRQFLGVFGGGGQGGQALAQGMSALSKGSKIDAMALGSFDVGPFHIEFDTKGLYISLSIAIPNISVGALALSNMSLGMKVSLLWDGSPILVDFNFCTKESQMTISVMGWAGGGYVLVKIATGEPVLRMLEIGFWFGASASIDIVVASGSVEIKGGFTFTIENKVEGGKTVEKLKFEAYIRLSGRLDILGIIKVSLTFELVLTYEQFDKGGGGGKGDRLTGTATLTVEIEIVFFSFSVNCTVSQKIAGKDPRFGDTYDESEWIAYCKAFAPATLGA